MTSERIQHMGLSPTLKVNAVAMEMAAAGVDVLDFSVLPFLDIGMDVLPAR